MVSVWADSDPGDTLATDATVLMARMMRGINAPVRSQPPYLIAFDSLWPISDKRWLSVHGRFAADNREPCGTPKFN